MTLGPMTKIVRGSGRDDSSARYIETHSIDEVQNITAKGMYACLT